MATKYLVLRGAPFGSVAMLVTRGLAMGAAPAPSSAPTDLAAAQAAGPHVDLTWTNLAVESTDYSVERRDATAGDAFAEIALTGSGTSESYHDTGPFTAKHRYAYRVVVVGGASDGDASNEVAIFGGTSHSGRMRRARY